MSTIYHYTGEWFTVGYNQQGEYFFNKRLGGSIGPKEMNAIVNGKVPHPSPRAIIRARVELEVEEP